MRRIICCITMITLLTGLWAMAESCTHNNLLMCSLRSECKDVGDGHQMVYTKSCVCDDCSENLVQRTYGPLMGHVFHLSESIHFEREGMHLWVFICPECWHVTLKEEACAGRDFHCSHRRHRTWYTPFDAHRLHLDIRCAGCTSTDCHECSFPPLPTNLSTA